MEAALNCLQDCHTLADIGCDHGQMSAYALQTKKCEAVIATDISAPSLQKARILAERFGFGELIQFRLGDGLQVLHSGEADHIALCGMGGLLIIEILEKTMTRLCGAKRVILQPMQHALALRAFLRLNGYGIVQEELVFENGRFFEIICIQDAMINYPNRWDAAFFDEMGPKLWEKRESLLIKKIQKRCKTLQIEIDQMQAATKENCYDEQIKKRKDQIEIWREILGAL